jgi:hypothetical protein
MHGIWIIFQAVSRLAIKIPSTLINILIEIRKNGKSALITETKKKQEALNEIYDFFFK